MQPIRDRSFRSALAYLSITSLLSTVAASGGEALNPKTAQAALGGRFSEIVRTISAETDSLKRSEHTATLIEKLKRYGHPVAEDSLVFVYFAGTAVRVSVASDLNGWSPSATPMDRISGTNFFYRGIPVPAAARFEYKLVVDSTWILDPGNPQYAIGGFGPNSEIWMPEYSAPAHLEENPSIPHGSIDTLSFTSTILGRTHPLFVYLPPGYTRSKAHYPVLYVTDGGEYLALALFNNILDNLIAEGSVRPIICIFIDPRTDPRRSETSTRMTDYTLNDSFVTFLADELRPSIQKKYRCIADADSTGIMGSSLGGLIATYAAFQRPDAFRLCAAQSPAYWWKDSRIIQLMASSPRKPITMYIDSGTLRDASVESRRMRDVLLDKGYTIHYEEHPEGHNWVNCRARIETIVKYFFGK